MPEGLGFKASVSYTNCLSRRRFWLFGKRTVYTKVIEEFHTEIDPCKKEITTWIPSTAGKEFQISWESVDKLNFDISGYVNADGQDIGGRYNLSNTTSPLSVFDSVKTSSESRCRLLFSPIIDIKGDDKCVHNVNLDDVGEIKLEIYEVDVGESAPELATLVKSKNIIHESEKFRKGIVHGVDFSREMKQIMASRKVAKRRRLVTFRFKYRPFDVLKADGKTKKL